MEFLIGLLILGGVVYALAWNDDAGRRLDAILSAFKRGRR